MERITACAARPDHHPAELDLVLFWKSVKRRLPLCLSLCAAVLALAAAYCLLSRPQYVARCRMLVEPERLNLTQIQEVYDGGFGSDMRSRDAFMATQIQLLGSDHILTRVFEHFRLAEREPFALAREPLKVLRRRMEIRRIPGTSLLDVGVRSEDPVFAAHAANFIARVYIDDSQRRASGFSLRGLAKLEEQLATTEETRLKAIERLNAFKKESGILSVSTSQALGIARLTELDRASVDAQAQLASAQAAVDTIERWRKAGMNLDSLPECVGNPALSSFKMARLEAQGALVKALRDFGPGHTSVEVQRQILRDMDAALAQERENSLFAAQASLEQARNRVHIIDKERLAARRELEHLDRIIDSYRMLEDELKAAENASKLVLQRVNELKIASSTASGAGGTFQIIVPASTPNRAVYPRRGRILAAALAGSVLFCAGLCAVLELFDRRIRRREEIEELTAVPIYGVIPRAAGNDLASALEAQGLCAEAFRSLRTSLSLSRAGRKARILAVVSASAGDGKTFCSLSLAVSYARAGKRVLLVDADMRRRRLSSLLYGKAIPEQGLSSLLASSCAPTDREDEADSVISAPLAGLALDVLNSGPIPPNPAELLGGEALRPLFQRLTARYDIILIDAPPLLQVSDARSLSVLPEAAFLVVVRMMHTERRPLLLAMDALRTVGAQALGAVMNCADEAADACYDRDSGYGYGAAEQEQSTDTPHTDPRNVASRNTSRIRAAFARLFRV